MGIQIGIMFANGARSAEPAHAVALAQSAEAAGYDSLWAVQHIAVPVEHDSVYPCSESGTIPGGPFVAVPEPLVWLAFAAAVTTRIRLVTGILILPEQHPLVVAKQAASLDRLSGGRLQLGVGAGWLREEFDAVGAVFDGRGARLDEAIDVMRRAWADRVAVSDGPAYPHGPVAVEPKPVHGAVPIVIGGHTSAAARRAGRLGDGFFPLAVRGEDLRRLVLEVRRHAEEAGRDPLAIEVSADPPRNEAEAEVLRELGVARVIVNAPHVETERLSDSLQERLERIRTLLPEATELLR
jgi:probable F420-dependent oxidoreductase